MVHDDTNKESSAPEPAPGEILDHLVWRELGFEKQFGMTFFEPTVHPPKTNSTDPHSHRDTLKINCRHGP